MAGKIFGTDGVRCEANGEWMNALFINKIAIAIYKVLFSTKADDKMVRVIIAKDTRKSGYMIESALASGLMSLGVHVILVGPIPTPAVPFLIKTKNADLGFMISASHNPYYDNGIKIFDKNGFKISDQIEAQIEEILFNENEYKYASLANILAQSDKIGYMSRIHNTADQYVDSILNNIGKEIKELHGLKIVLDCANGAAYKVAALLFNKLGSANIIINNNPDGTNINKECGAIHPEQLSEAVKKHKADLGIALDGDADRICLCDEKGEVIDNDKLMAIIAVYFKKLHKLKGNSLAVTIISNSGLEEYLAKYDIKVHRTAVGDKYINEALQTNNYNFGGEKSGHIIFGDYSQSGDGLLSGAFIAHIINESQQKASALFEEVKLFSQVTRNVNYKNEQILEHPHIQENINNFQALLGSEGRILVRKSGTEPKIRLMAEGNDLMQINNILDSLTRLIADFA